MPIELIQIFKLIFLSVTPVFELRASIPYGILMTNLHWSVVFVICALSNFIIAPLLYIFFDKFVHFLFFIKPFEKVYKYYVEKTQNKVRKYVEKYGVFGLALFIGVPLPGSGVWTASLAAYLFGMSKKQLTAAAFFGVIIAGIIVTAIVLSGSTLFEFFITRYS